MDITEFVQLAGFDRAAAQRHTDSLSYGRLNEMRRYLAESDGDSFTYVALGLVRDAIANIEQEESGQ